jgi:hypothetical protein
LSSQNIPPEEAGANAEAEPTRDAIRASFISICLLLADGLDEDTHESERRKEREPRYISHKIVLDLRFQKKDTPT